MRRAKKLNIGISTLEEIEIWHKESIKKCAYCGILEETWEMLYKGVQNHYSLALDRKDSFVGYTTDNLALACGICNSVKSNVLSYNEMIEVGEKYIKPKWQRKIQEKQNVERANTTL